MAFSNLDSKNLKVCNLILFGLGPHAKRIYMPALQKLQCRYNAQIKLVVELDITAKETAEYVNNINPYIDKYFVAPFTTKMPKDTEMYLDKYVKENNINSVIIATEPLSHARYAKWALKNGLHILMDKPISTRENVVTDIEEAKALEGDYQELINLYNSNSTNAFIINVQRRYHPGFKFVFNKIKEISQQFNIPVTAIQSSHCDGQWRLPTEIVSQNYHPYNKGYGKGSHSGYHIFDSVYNFYKSGLPISKVPNEIEAYASFVQPDGFIRQLTYKDYEKIFGDEYKNVSKFSDEDLMSRFNTYGEMDIAGVYRFLRGGVNICNVSINLMHNGFARRTWITPGKDLYKGNGRVKHEYHNIQQGPFQNIQIHSYQSNDKHDTNTEEDFLLGGNNHFDIYVFRNNKLTGDTNPLEKYSINNIEDCDSQKLVVEQTKHAVVEEFIRYVLGYLTKQELLSNIEDHDVPVKLMSMTYQSHVKQSSNLNPIIKNTF